MAIIGAIMTGYLFMCNLLLRCFNKKNLQGELYLVDQNEPCAELLKKRRVMRKLKKMKARMNKKNHKKNLIMKQQKRVLEKKTQELKEIKDIKKSSSELIWEISKNHSQLRLLCNERFQNQKLTKYFSKIS
mmetsp:Transcript_2570/g.3154  ORF Transcript_2570/g.3154 Transcript_2570/m.3154 type:complete len:131 (+) Transcript_2570:126-518(+)